LRVLLVDGSPIVRKRLMALLLEVPEMVVGEAKDESEASKLLPELKPEAVVLDIQMPGGSGIDLLQKIKRGQNPPLVIILTNLSGQQYYKRCMEAGADFFFDKSTEFDSFVEVLTRYRKDS
jgi:DNA-binding NarL/FixJ family response regulator